MSNVRCHPAHHEDPHTAASAREPPRDHGSRPLGAQVRRQVQGRNEARPEPSSRWTLLIIILSTTSSENQFDQSCVTVR